MDALYEDWKQEQIENHDHFADLMALIANVNRNPKKRASPYEAKQFSWRASEQKKEMTDDEIYKALRAAFGPERVKQRKRN